MIGLDTPKASRRVLRSYNLSSAGTSRSEVQEPTSPTDSLNTLIEKTLGSSRMSELSSPIKGAHENNDSGNYLSPSDSFDNFEEILAKLSMSGPSSPIELESNDVFNDIHCGIMKYARESDVSKPEVERGDVFTAFLIDFNQTSHKLIDSLIQLQVIEFLVFVELVNHELFREK